MGISDAINAGLGKLEGVVDGVKQGAGELVEASTDVVADGLDYVGAEGVADNVEGWGDGVASDLGAEVAEDRLGTTDDPKQLVHGDPEAIRESAAHLKDFHDAFERVGTGMRGLDSSSWRGEAAEAFRDKFTMHPKKWMHAADSCGQAAEALNRFAETVTWAQRQAEDAIALHKRGKEESERAVSSYNKRVDAYNAAVAEQRDPGPTPETFSDPGVADQKRAAELLEEARRQRDDMGRVATASVKEALAHAPAEPPPLDRAEMGLLDYGVSQGVELTHFAGGVVKGAAGIVTFARGLIPFDPYNVTHPAAYMQNLSLTASGLVSTVAHPERAVKGAIDGFKKDPSEFLGRLVPELIGTKGAGLARSALRHGVKTGADVAESGGKRGARDAVEEDPAQPSRVDESVESGGTDPIDLATGKMYLPQSDVTLPGVLPLVFKRRVESGYHLGRWFGPSWTSTVDQRLEIDSEGVMLVDEDGLLLAYPHPAPGVPVMPSHGPRRPLDRAEDGAGYTVTDPETGRVRHFADRGEHLSVIEQIDDRNGNWITFSYDADGTPTEINHCGGYRLRLTTAEGRVTALHLAAAAPDGTDRQLLGYGYDESGNLVTVTNSSGLPLQFTYDEASRVTSWTDTNDRSYTYEYDTADRCIAEGGSEGHMALRLDYDTVDPATGLRVTRAVTGEGHERRYLINDRHQVVADIDPLGAVTRFERDRYNRLLTHTDPLGHTTSYRYDEDGRLAAATRADGRETHAEYNEHGRPTRVVRPDGTVWHHAYDERGNRTAVTSPSGATTRYAYTEAGHLAAVTDALGATTRVRCDASGLPVEVVDPLGAVTRYERDAYGRPLRVVDPMGAVTHLEWTVEGKLSRRTAPDGSSESWTYDGEGNCTTHTDPMGGVTRFEYTHFDLLAARTGPDGVRYEFDHDAELRLTQVTNPQGLTWSYTYDPAGRLTSETDFDDRTLTYAHDATGRLTARTNGLGETITFERNALGRITRKDAAGRVTTFAYDLTDQLAEARGPDATLELLRDRDGRLKYETVNGRRLSYEYDVLGRRVGRTTPAGAHSRWAYDAAGNRTELTTSGRTMTFDHDAAGRELTRRVGDALSVTQMYDPLGRLTAQTVTGAGGGAGADTPVQHRSYGYRADGHLTRIDDQLNGTRHFDLDAVGRVTAVRAAGWTETYAYDEAGNQTDASWPSPMPGSQDATGPRTYAGTRIRTAGGVRYEHDAQGRVVLRQKTRLSRKPDTWHYEWDAEDRLTSVVTPDGVRWRYAYDPLGRRTSKQRLALDGESVAEQVDFTWDGPMLCDQTSHVSGAPEMVTLTWEYEGLHPLAQTERKQLTDDEVDERFFTIVTDLVGTPTELLDEAGEIAWRARTTLWGSTAWYRGATAYTPLRFPGQYFDAETGLHYNYFRHYDPEASRYLTLDPLGLDPAPNPVAYVSNPHASVDPLGLSPYELDPGKSSGQLRNSPGVVTGGDSLPNVEGQWLRGSEGNAGRVPGQVAEGLQGREFESFDKFRKAFWEEVSRHPELAGQFDKSAQTAMANGNAPFAPTAQHHGQGRYVLHHMQPIQRGGGVYDLDNLAVVTPRYHKEILDGGYHFGNG
ncbi:RHS repeat-associated core domain-containing protein [Streptomyces sp. B-S-A8]|uniref:RHS repeat-associated core domain-containing protein n=1 Tax=Streptomyces solicavernae TaxID=3043614 RepID=A0ABT6S234_9ACTN|nr:DUF6531 domain-containing protein [Streptomyces sp. B-S-A8]MDI3390734.1 RHS repeat-associated core domain-containing protein [Streptomyces sp. B-S-A8]